MLFRRLLLGVQNVSTVPARGVVAVFPMRCPASLDASVAIVKAVPKQTPGRRGDTLPILYSLLDVCWYVEDRG